MNSMIKSLKTLSFSSPKGGVGRTMTLTNCANIYSRGVDWAGIEPSNTLLFDFDFHAPGIQFYDFQKEEILKKYQIGDNLFSTFIELQSFLGKNKTGVAFLFTKIIQNLSYVQKCEDTIRGMKKNETDALKNFQNFVFQLFEQKEYDPINHLIQVPSKSIYILPAGSPVESTYNEVVFKFEWLRFINNYMGIHLIDCIIFRLVKFIKGIDSNIQKPTRILLDQQAGMSISAALNRTLANAHILVGGFNAQNKYGLEALVNNFYESYIDKHPYLVLNQYNYRDLAFQYSFSDSTNSPHEVFCKIDKEERIEFLTLLTKEHPDLESQIFITEFDRDAIQKEHFHSAEKVSVQELVKLIVSVEKGFSPPIQTSFVVPSKGKVTFIGEKIEFNAGYSGPFNGLHVLLKNYFQSTDTPSTDVISIAASHEDIVSLTAGLTLKAEISKEGEVYSVDNILNLSKGQYTLTLKDDGVTPISLSDFDFISYPYYAVNNLIDRGSILKFNSNEFVKKIPVSNSLVGTNYSYYKSNIFRWSEYCEFGSAVIGVPLFFNAQLLAYRKEYFGKRNNLSDEYRKEFHRRFEGFYDPDDILRFAKLTKDKPDDVFKSVLLCANSKHIAMWYEWQTIFSMFYYDNHGLIKQNNSFEEYLAFLLTPVSLDATLMYLKLRKWAKGTNEDDANSVKQDENDWDELIRDFYLDKISSLIFLWPDSIPLSERKKADYVYQVPPSFHVFEECWLLSLGSKTNNDISTEEKLKFLNKYLTPESQMEYVKEGGLPVHKDILSSLNVWQEYPFIPPLWSIYYGESTKNIINKRECFDGIYNAGKKISEIIGSAFDTLDFKKNDNDLKNDVENLIKAKFIK